ncbi:FAD-dependent monooxygenase [Kitasatospora sp. NPDC056327]|uniref:FAD-dependent monooxygenase n=1 Tax=Kitasatospora sp. NPDC056327 TaxID=3345785 RepID=UPI0035E16E3E
MEIVIAGAGIGGLTAALCLHTVGLRDVRVLEVVPQIRPMGAGVNLLPNAVRELAGLGLAEKLADLGADLTELGYYNHLGQEIWREPRGRANGSRWPQLALHRGALQTTLADRVRDCLGEDAIVTDARVTGFEQLVGGGVDVTVAHRLGERPTSVIRADVLVGADGLRSAVRRVLYPQEGEPRFNGTDVWRGITRTAPFRGGRSMVVMGDGHWKAVVYPVAVRPDDDGLVPVNWAVSRAAREDAVPAAPAAGTSPQAPRDTGSGAGPDAGSGDGSGDGPGDGFPAAVAGWRCGDLRMDALVAGADAGASFPMLDRDPVPRWSFGAVTLLGDAAHAMAPMGSNATTQAVLDARSLAHALATHDDPAEALAAYDRDRRPRMNRLQLINRAKGPEVVIDLVHERAPEGFGGVESVLSTDRLAQIADAYARAAGSDPESVNSASPYGPPARAPRRETADVTVSDTPSATTHSSHPVSGET